MNERRKGRPSTLEPRPPTTTTTGVIKHYSLFGAPEGSISFLSAGEFHRISQSRALAHPAISPLSRQPHHAIIGFLFLVSGSSSVSVSLSLSLSVDADHVNAYFVPSYLATLLPYPPASVKTGNTLGVRSTLRIPRPCTYLPTLGK